MIMIRSRTIWTLCLLAITFFLIVLGLGCLTVAQRRSLPLPPSNRQRKLHLLLPINIDVADQSSRFCKTLLSALVHGYEPTIINWDLLGDRELMHIMKVFGVHEYLENLATGSPESDLIFMIDALDVWLQLSPATLIERFEELGTVGVVTGADRACWPNEWNSSACQDVPESPISKCVYNSEIGPEGNAMPHTRPRWANSGAVIGSVSAMRDLYKDLVDEFRVPGKHVSDQGAFNILHAAKRLTIDYHSRLFWQTAFANPTNNTAFLNTPRRIDPYIPHELYPPLLYQTQTGEIPVAIHFNAHEDKGLMDDWWGSLWWNQLGEGNDAGGSGCGEGRFRRIVESRLKAKMIRLFFGTEEQWKAWSDVCPKEMLGI